jgi:putative oxidoreductase
MLRKIIGMVGVLGRVMLCAVFLAAALGYTVPNAQNMAQSLAAKWAVAPGWAIVGGGALLIVGSLSVVLGYRARFGALALLVFLMLATYYFHGFTLWTLLSAHARHEQMVYLVTNLSMMGAMLFIIANGPGEMSLDAKRG